jgi:ABC-type spermidine/putrescine transport system permease subunit I
MAAMMVALRRRRSPLYGPLVLFALLTPFLALLAIGLGYPLVHALVDSLNAKGSEAHAYRRVLDDDVFLHTLVRTLRTAAIVSVVSLIIGYPTAEFIHRASPRWRPLLLLAVIVPLWSSSIARTYGWVGVFERNGLADRIAGWFGHGPLQLLYTQLAVTVGMVHVLMPILLLPVYVAVARYDDRLDFASRSLGAGRWRTLVRVKLPTLAPQLIASTTLVFIIALGFFITPAVLGGPRSQLVSRLISEQIFQRFDVPRAEAMSILLLGATLAVLVAAGLIVAVTRWARR